MILPGLVNAHSHLEYAVYAGFGDSRVFADWLGVHIVRKRALVHDEMVAIARRGAADSLAAGITTTADYSFSGASAAAAAELGLRAIVYLEVFGADPELTRVAVRRAPPPRAGDRARAPRHLAARAVHLLARRLPLVPLARHPRRDASRRERGRERVARLGTGPMAVNRDVLVAPTGQRAVATLADVLGPRLLCAHCVHVTDDEIAQLARLDVPVAHCPRSNALLGCGTAPLAELRAAGVRVGLGTDSPASTPSFDVWEELRTAVS